MTRDRAELPARPDQQRGGHVFVDDPAIGHPAQRGHGGPFDHFDARAAEKIPIELAATDAVADDGFVSCPDRPSIGQDARAEARHVLHHESARPVLLGREAEDLEDPRRNPARAHLVARKARTIQHEHVRTRAPERPGARRARGAAAGDNDVDVPHQRSPASSE